LFLKLVGGLNLEVHSVDSKYGLGHLLNLGSLGCHHFNIVLGVLGASEGRGTSVLLTHVELLDLSFHAVHHHGNLLRLGAVVLDNLENIYPPVSSKHGLGVLRCLDVLHGQVLLGKFHVHVDLGNGKGGGGVVYLVVGGEGVDSDEFLVVSSEGGSGVLLVNGGKGGSGELLVDFVLDTSFSSLSSLSGVHN
jgi:hypothetical protein